ncbi:MAG TPA: von Willebrand factor type A domain-containing protein [Ferruginibacter sp.]|nr:von Willebrand factor type A domain-containing protein [Ferruginibacter sp.]
MKKIATYCLTLLIVFPSFSQFYLRGEVKDEKNNALQNVKIFVHSVKAMYVSGFQGSFGFTVVNPYDSLTFFLDGYESKTLRVKTNQWQSIILKAAADQVTKNKQKLISVTRDFSQSAKFNSIFNDETYFQLVENEFVNTDHFPNTGFSLDVDKASYSNVRRFINMKSAVPPDAVRIEELINYFNLYYKEPPPDEIFNINSQLTSCPWNENEQLLFLNVSAKKLDLDKVPPGNFVFLIDISGSMDMPNRLPLLKASFQSFVKNLRPIDKVSIVVYGGTVGVWLQPTFGDDKATIIQSIEELTASGATPGESGIRTAYKLAESTFIKGGNNRVILATDGDFNIGETSEKSLDELITKMRQTGVYLTCLGVGMGNFKDSKLQTLAKKGNGNYAYLDNIKEAEKVLVKELTQTFYAVADDIFMNVRFNPSMVKEYRLIGFDNKKEAIADPSNNLDGGEVGSGNSTLAIFEIVPTQQNTLTLNSPLADDLAALTLRYSLCNDTSNKNINHKVTANYIPFNSIDPELQFATSVTMFALKLKDSKYIHNTDWSSVVAVASVSADTNNYLQKEFLQLLEKVQKIYPEKKKKKKE